MGMMTTPEEIPEWVTAWQKENPRAATEFGKPLSEISLEGMYEQFKQGWGGESFGAKGFESYAANPKVAARLREWAAATDAVGPDEQGRYNSLINAPGHGGSYNVTNITRTGPNENTITYVDGTTSKSEIRTKDPNQGWYDAAPYITAAVGAAALAPAFLPGIYGAEAASGAGAGMMGAPTAGTGALVYGSPEFIAAGGELGMSPAATMSLTNTSLGGMSALQGAGMAGELTAGQIASRALIPQAIRMGTQALMGSGGSPVGGYSSTGGLMSGNSGTGSTDNQLRPRGTFVPQYADTNMFRRLYGKF